MTDSAEMKTSAQAHEKETSSQLRSGATLAALCSIVFWCWSGVAFRAGSSTIGSMPYLTLSCIVGVLAIVVLHVLTGKPVSRLFMVPLKVRIAGFFGVALYTVTLVYAMGIADESDLGTVMLINYLWPLWIVVLGLFMLEDKPNALLVISGAILGLAGIAVVGGLDTLTRTPSHLLPHLLALAGGFLWALYSVLLRKWRIPEEKGGSTFHFAMCALLAAVFGLQQGQWPHLSHISWRTVFWVFFLGIGPIGLAYYWWEIGIKRGAVHFIAVMSYFIPLFSAILIGAFFRKALNGRLVPGAIMITAGAYLGRLAVTRAPRGALAVPVSKKPGKPQ